MNIVLCGIKHCGKTTLGRGLARARAVDFRDSDAELERRFEREHNRAATVREIFREIGETEFRRLEAAVLDELAAEPAPRVLALGGGALSNPFVSPKTIRELGLMVFIDVADDVAFARIKRRGLPPFLEQSADPEAEFRRLNAERRPVFLKFARICFKVETERPAAETAAELAKKIRETAE